MEVSAGLWVGTLLVLVGVILLDLVIVERRDRPFTSRNAVHWVVFYVAFAAAFAVFVSVMFGPIYGGQFVAGYLTEYSLSVDNLFVFMIIMSSFAVPAILEHRVLLVGVVIALVLRGILIVVGAELIARFEVTFYIFGLFLLFTAWKVWAAHDAEPDPDGNALIRWVGTHVPTSTEYNGSHLLTRVAGRRALTPMALVMLAIGTTDLLFAIDSIPAVFGITAETYLVFTVNAFALMGLRQLYFLLRGVLGRLRYLNRGLAVVLAFIGLKMVIEAVNATTSLELPTISTWLSLLVIVGVLSVTALVSVYGTRGDVQDAI
ncbi:MAG: TerC/Alx family metal homeostasis membrane protein [Actinobacteria bacterium]|nr:TerC/Alx family metal homeostasis membrane protein [Actinomycetota bacterium]